MSWLTGALLMTPTIPHIISFHLLAGLTRILSGCSEAIGLTNQGFQGFFTKARFGVIPSAMQVQWLAKP